MIYVIDSLMGTGKTTNIYQEINRHPEKKYVFMTPLLAEFERLQNACQSIGFAEPMPYPNKQIHLKNLLKVGQNVVTSHELVKRLKFTEEDKSIIQNYKYTLIIDEAVDTICSIQNFNLYDYEYISDSISVDNNGQVKWLEENPEHIALRYHDLYELSQTGNLFAYDSFLLWKLPLDFIDCFEDVYIMTYNFEGSHMAYDFKVDGYDYTMCHFEDGEIKEGRQDISKYIEAFQNRVKIYDGKINAIGDKFYSLSATEWKRLKKNSNNELTEMTNKFRAIFRTQGQPVERCMYTRFKQPDETIEDEIKYSIRDYKSASFVPFNATGTNAYRLKTSLIYGVNVFEHPAVVNYYKSRDGKSHKINYKPDDYALNTMLQWIYRSAIRNVDVPPSNQYYKINLAIPSKRMRSMLTNWIKENVN